MEVTVGTFWVSKKSAGPAPVFSLWREFYSEFRTDHEQLSEGVSVCQSHRRIILEYEVDRG